MGNFCSKCGAPTIEETGLCSVCDKVSEENNAVKKEFCGFCGNEINAKNGLCSVCGGEKTMTVQQVETSSDESNEKNQSSKKGKKVKAYGPGRTVTVVLLAILLFIMSFSTLLVGTVRNVKDKETVEHVLEQVDLSKIIKQNFGIVVKNKGYMSPQYFLEYHFRDKGIDVTDKKFNKFLEKSTIKEFLGEKTEEYLDSIVDEKDEFEFTERELITLVSENVRPFESVFDIEVEYDNYKLMQNFENLRGDSGKLKSLSALDLKYDEPEIYYTIKVLLSPVTWLILNSVCLLLIVAMILSHRKKGVTAFCMVAIIVGTLMSVASITACVIAVFVETNLVLSVAFTLLMEGLVLYLGVLILGVLVLIGRKHILKLLKKKTEKIN